MADGDGSDSPVSGVDRLRAEVGQLAVDEILALCYSFQQKPARLRLYLDVLRRRGGQRAQFASCLLCFDLARQGDTALQHDFVFLAGAIRDLARDEAFVESMVGDDPYLSFIWDLLAAQLEEMDARFETEHTVQTTLPETTEEIGALDLLSDADLADELGDFSLDVDEPALRAAFEHSVDNFLGKVPGIPAYDPSCGFRLQNRHDIERTERFLLELESLRGPVPLARAYRALVLLAYGTHMRSKSLFGAVNERKQRMLREGLDEWLGCVEQLWQIIGVLQMHGERSMWLKIAEVITDFVHWNAYREPGDARPRDYPAVERQIERDRHRGGRRRARRGDTP